MARLTTKDKTFYDPSTAKRILRRPDFRNLIIPKLSGAPISLNQVDYDELEILQSYRSYSPDAPDEVKYFIYKLAQKNPEDLVHHTFYKAIRMVRLTRVPRYLREITAASGPDMIFEQQRDVLAALREQGALFTNIIAKSPEIPMIFAYGVQGIGDTLEEAQRRADEGYAVLTFQLNGTYQQLEYKPITVREGELLARYQMEWRELAMARGRPLPVGTTSGMIPLIEGNRTEVESTNNQLESFLRGMGDKSFMMSLITVPISPAEITLAWRNLTEKLSAVRSDQEGARSFTAGVALPLTFGNSLGASAGTTHGETATQGSSIAHGVSSSVSHGLSNSLTNTLSHSTTQGTSTSESHSTSTSATQGVSQTQGTSVSQGQSTALGQSNSLSHTSTLGSNASTSIGHSLTHSASSTQGASQGTSESSTQGTSITNTTGNSHSATSGTSSSQGVSGSSTASQSTSATQGTSQSLTGSASTTQGQSFGISSSTGTGTSSSLSASRTDGINNSIPGIIGSNHSTTSSATNGQSASNSSGVSLSQSGSATVGHSFGSGISNSQSSSNSIAQTIGQTATTGTSQSNTNSVSQSSAVGQSVSATQGTSATLSQSATTGVSQGTTASASQGSSQSNAVGNTSGVSLTNSASQGLSSSASSSTSNSLTNGVTNGLSQSQSQSVTNGASQAVGTSSSATNTSGNSTTNSNSSSLANAYGIANTQTDSTTGAIGLIPSLGVSVSRHTYNESKRIIGDIMEAQMRRYIEGIKSGAFFYQMFLLCPDRETLVGAEGLLKSAFWGPGTPRDQLPQPFHVIDKFPGGQAERDRLLTHAAAFSSYRLREEMVELIEPLRYSTYITPTEAAAFTHPPTAESLGILAVHDSMPVTAMPADRSNREITMGKIINGERAMVSTWNYGVDLNELTHVLIGGQTGSGKTTTLMKFLSEVVQMKKTVTQMPTIENPVVTQKEVQASILGLDWMPNMRNLASIVSPDRFRFYSLARPELGLFRWNLLEIPAEGMSPLEWLGAQADNFTASFNLRDYGRSLISEFLTDLYSANRLQDFILRPATLDTQGQEIRPAIILPAIDPSTLPPGAIQTGVDGELVANVFTYPPLSRLVSICDLAVLVAARVEEVADPNKARLYGTDMRDRIQSLWRRLQYFVPDGPYAQVLSGDPSLTQRTTLGVTDIIDPDRGLVTIVETEGLDYPHRRLLIGSILLAVYRYGLHHGKGTFNQNDQGPGTIIVLEEAHELFGEQGPDENGDAAATRTALYESIFRRARALGLHLVAVAQEPSKLPSAVTANINAVFIHTLREKQERDKAFSLLNWSNQIGQQAREYRYLGELPRGYSLVSLTAQKHYLQAAPVQIKVDEAPLAEVSDKDLLTRYNNFVTKIKKRNP